MRHDLLQMAGQIAKWHDPCRWRAFPVHPQVARPCGPQYMELKAWPHIHLEWTCQPHWFHLYSTAICGRWCQNATNPVECTIHAFDSDRTCPCHRTLAALLDTTWTVAHLVGVQACRLPALKPLKRLKNPESLKTLKNLKTVQKLLGTSNRAGKSCHKATSIASSGRSSLPFASRYTLQTLQTLKHSLGMLNPAVNRHPKATSMASYGRPSLPFASP